MLGKYLLEKKQSINRDLVEEYKKMKKSEIIKKVAPCSLMCHGLSRARFAQEESPGNTEHPTS